MTQPEIVNLKISEVVAGNNDRTTFDPIALQELADSIREHGLIQPITVRQLTDDGHDTGLYQIIAGERRYRACQSINFTQHPPGQSGPQPRPASWYRPRFSKGYHVRESRYTQNSSKGIKRIPQLSQAGL